MMSEVYWNVSGVFHRMLNAHPLEFLNAQKNKKCFYFEVNADVGLKFRL